MNNNNVKTKGSGPERAADTCPGEDVLNGYLTQSLSEEVSAEAERHIARCGACLFKIAEAYEVINEKRFKLTKEHVMKVLKKINIWLISCILMFASSFIFPRFFLQFLVGAAILGAKWIIDSKNTKMLIMIYDAWKHGGHKEAGKILDSFNSRFKR